MEAEKEIGRIEDLEEKLDSEEKEGIKNIYNHSTSFPQRQEAGKALGYSNLRIRVHETYLMFAEYMKS